MLKALFNDRAPELIQFDLDGTLIDSVPDLADAIDAMLGELRLPLAGETRVRCWVGNGARMLVRRALAWAQGQPSLEMLDQAHLAEAHALFLAAYRNCFHIRTQLYPGVRQALQHWQAQAIPLALVTNKPIEFVDPLLQHFGLASFFSITIGGDSLPSKKPDPLPLLHVCECLGVAPAQSLMLGDSRADVEAARAAGMPVICVSYGYNHGEPVSAAAPDAVIDSLTRLL